ncbi:unnamed protein product [Ectocarpus sp. 12 AP-2014]
MVRSTPAVGWTGGEEVSCWSHCPVIPPSPPGCCCGGGPRTWSAVEGLSSAPRSNPLGPSANAPSFALPFSPFTGSFPPRSSVPFTTPSVPTANLSLPALKNGLLLLMLLMLLPLAASLTTPIARFPPCLSFVSKVFAGGGRARLLTPAPPSLGAAPPLASTIVAASTGSGDTLLLSPPPLPQLMAAGTTRRS